MARPLKVTVQNVDGVDSVDTDVVEEVTTVIPIVTNVVMPTITPTVVKAALTKVKVIALKTVKSNIGGVPYEIEKGKSYEFPCLVAAVLCNAGAAART